jgi:preprotein translocase subunit Sec61beta
MRARGYKFRAKILLSCCGALPRDRLRKAVSHIRFLYGPSIVTAMAKKDNSSFASSAGLMRYFDTEDDKGLKLSPKTIIGAAIAFTIIILLVPVFFPA